MKTLDLVQGSEEWHTERVKSLTASEAPVMMAASPKMRRDDLLSLKKYAIEKDHSDYVQKFLFDKGHEYEALARPIVEEKVVGKDLYPVTGKDDIDGLPILASYDGLTMMEDIGFEHKMWNPSLAEDVRNEDLSPEYFWQLEHQLLLGPEKILFVVSDGTENNMEYMWYTPVPGRREQLLAGWKQFVADLEDHEHIENPEKPEVAVIQSLPALNVEVSGKVLASNIQVFEISAMEFIADINTDLKTDEDFANAENQVKFCADVESQLEAVKKHGLSQMGDIDALFASIDRISESVRRKRIDLGNMVKDKKASIKAKFIEEGNAKVGEHQDMLAESLGGDYLTHTADFASVIKGKRTFKTISGAINDEVARVKIELNDRAETVRSNLKCLDEQEEYKFLFNDLDSIINKAQEDFSLLVESRINTYKEEQRQKAQAEEEEVAEVEKIEQENKQSDDKTLADQMNHSPDIGDDSNSDKEPVELSKAEQKRQAADVKKLKTYMARLTGYKVPSVEDPKVSEILGKITSYLGSAEDRINDIYPVHQGKSKAA